MDTTKTRTVLVLEQHSDAERFAYVSYGVKRTWDEMIARFPACVKEVRENARASYGSSNWIKGSDGRIELDSDNWDSGD